MGFFGLGAQNFAHSIARNIQLSGDLLHRPALNMEGSSDMGNRIHSLQLPTPSAVKSRMVGWNPEGVKIG
jgi:hypothetical protein